MTKATLYITETRHHKYEFEGSKEDLQEILELEEIDPDSLGDYCSSATLEVGEFELDHHIKFGLWATATFLVFFLQVLKPQAMNRVFRPSTNWRDHLLVFNVSVWVMMIIFASMDSGEQQCFWLTN